MLLDTEIVLDEFCLDEPPDWTGFLPDKSNPPELWHKEYLEKFGPSVTRFEVCGCNFTVLEHGPGLYTSINLALSGNSHETIDYKEDVLEHFWTHWSSWSTKLELAFPDIIPPEVKSHNLIPKDTLLNYIRVRLPETGSIIELEIIAEIMQFDFTIIFITKFQKTCRVKNYLGTKSSKVKAKYVFLYLEDPDMNEHFWAFLYPIGPLMDVTDGVYKYLVKYTFIFPIHNPYPPLDEPKESWFLTEFGFPKSAKKIVLANGSKEFYMYNTDGNLYEILSELGYSDKSKASQIKVSLMKLRIHYSYQLNLNPHRKKTVQDKLQTSNYRAFNQQLSGDPLDLQIASDFLGFSSYLFGLIDKSKTSFFNYTEHQKNSNTESNSSIPSFGFLLWAKNSRKEIFKGDWKWYFLLPSKTLRNIFRIEREEISSGPVLSALDSRPMIKNEEIPCTEKLSSTSQESQKKSIIVEMSGGSELEVDKEKTEDIDFISDKSSNDSLFAPVIHPSLNFYEVANKKLKPKYISKRKPLKVVELDKTNSTTNTEIISRGFDSLISMPQSAFASIVKSVGAGLNWLSERAKMKTNVEYNFAENVHDVIDAEDSHSSTT